MRITTTLTPRNTSTLSPAATLALATLLSQPGAPGVKGSIWYAGTGAPSESVGTAGDYYIAEDTLCLYGPKTTVWGDSFACVAGTILADRVVDVITAMADPTVTFEPTGFVDGANIGVAYDKVARTITLSHASGTIQYKWRGVLKSLVSPWTSDPHAVGASRYFLSSVDGDTFPWSTTPFDYKDVQTALALPGLGFAVREPHGFMPHEAHTEAHDLLGTYRVSGLGPVAGTYTEATATDAATTPGFAAGVIKDEDNSSYVNATAEGTYTTMRVDAGGVAAFDTAATFPFRSAGANTFIYTNNPTTGAETATATNRFVNVYEILIPVTSDADSQLFRRVFLQPQVAYSALAAAQAEDTRGLSLGDFAGLAPELVFYTRLTYATSNANANTGKVTIPAAGITYVVGTRTSQINVGAVLQGAVAENVITVPFDDVVATNQQATNEEIAAKRVKVAGGTINGQRDTLISHAPANGSTTVIDYLDGNAHYLDLSALNNTHAITLTANNWPAAATDYAAMTLVLKTGATLPAITWPAGWVTLVPAVSKTSEYVVRSLGTAAPRMALVEAY